MSSTINIALSGLNAASTQIAVSANNIANQFSTSTNTNGTVTNIPYVPQQVDQISLSTGGVATKVSNVSNPTTTVPDPQGSSGTKQEPNVDPANELIQQNIASYDFKANLKTIKTQDNIFQSLLNILS